MQNTEANHTRKHIDVVVGVIECSEKGVLISKRQKGQHLSGFWEFPGGKVEHNEPLQQALARELNEELGITLDGSDGLSFLQKIDFDYPEKSVSLHVFLVSAFSGQACGAEGQEIRWVARENLSGYTFPPANTPILDTLLADVNP